MDEMRKAFEAWAQESGWDTAVRFMWEAWQAACAAEREACAAICYAETEKATTPSGALHALICASAIRARSQQ